MKESPEVTDEWPGWDALKPTAVRKPALKTPLAGGYSPSRLPAKHPRQRTAPTMSPPRPPDAPVQDREVDAASFTSPDARNLAQDMSAAKLAEVEAALEEKTLAIASMKKEAQSTQRELAALRNEAERRGGFVKDVCRVLSFPQELEHLAADELLQSTFNERIAILNGQSNELADLHTQVTRLANVFDLPADSSIESLHASATVLHERGRADTEVLEGLRVQLETARSQRSALEAKLHNQLQEQAQQHDAETRTFSATVNDLHQRLEESAALADRQQRANEDLRRDLEGEGRRRTELGRELAGSSDELLAVKKGLNDAHAQQHATALEVERLHGELSACTEQLTHYEENIACMANLLGIEPASVQQCRMAVKAQRNECREASTLLEEAQRALAEQQCLMTTEADVYMREMEEMRKLHSHELEKVELAWSSEVLSLTNSLSTERDCVEVVSAELGDLQQLMRDADGSMRLAASSWDELHVSHTCLEERNRQYEAEVAELRAALDEAVHQEEGHVAAHDALEEERARLDSEVCRLTRKLDALKRQKVEASSVSLQSRIAEVNATNDLHDARETVVAIVDGISEALRKSFTSDTCVGAVRALAGERAKLLKSNREKAQRLQLLEKSKQMLKDSTSTLEKERAALMLQIESLQHERVGLRRVRSEAQVQSARSEHLRATAEDAQRQTEARLREVQDSADQQYAELQALRATSEEDSATVVRSLAHDLTGSKDQEDVQTAIQSPTERATDQENQECHRAQLAAAADEVRTCRGIISEYEGNMRKVQYEHEALLLTLRDQIENLTDEGEALRRQCALQDATGAELRALGFDQDLVATIRKLLSERDDLEASLQAAHMADTDECSEASRYESKAAAAEMELLRVHMDQIAKLVCSNGTYLDCVEAVAAVVHQCGAQAASLKASLTTSVSSAYMRERLSAVCPEDSVPVESIAEVVQVLGLPEDSAKGLLKMATGSPTSCLSHDDVEAWWRDEKGQQLDTVLFSPTYEETAALQALQVGYKLTTTAQSATLRTLFAEWWLCSPSLPEVDSI